MACAGLQNENKNHAVSCIQMGLDMLHLTSRLQLDNGDPINIRIGIHTGMVLSGKIRNFMKRQFYISPLLSIDLLLSCFALFCFSIASKVLLE